MAHNTVDKGPMIFARNVVTLTLRIQPGASKSGSAGVYGEKALKLRIAAPAVEGKANRACIKVLAGMFGVPPSAVTILRGEASRDKLIRIEGVSEPRYQTVRAQWLA